MNKAYTSRQFEELVKPYRAGPPELYTSRDARIDVATSDQHRYGSDIGWFAFMQEYDQEDIHIHWARWDNGILTKGNKL